MVGVKRVVFIVRVSPSISEINVAATNLSVAPIMSR